jgi:Flp pilus assembly pilin Flp
MRLLRKLWRDKRGQDLIEYALLAAFMAVSVGAISPTLAQGFITMMSKVNNVIVGAGGGSG